MEQTNMADTISAIPLHLVLETAKANRQGISGQPYCGAGTFMKMTSVTGPP